MAARHEQHAAERIEVELKELEDRVRLWQRHHDVCDRIAKLRLRERNLRQESSRRNREMILTILKEAEKTSADEMREMLELALTRIKESFLLRLDRQECWSAWRIVDRRLYEKKAESDGQVRRETSRLSPQTADRIDFLLGVIERKKQARDRAGRLVQELREGVRNAWNLEWATRAKRWATEREAKAKEIDKDIERLQEEIRNLRNHSNI